MADIKELAVAYWRMNKWLENTNAERKMAATSSLRSIKRYLDSNNIEILDLTGQKFDDGLAVDIVNNDVPEENGNENVLISEMIKPIVMQNGTVIQFGQVSIGLNVKNTEENLVKVESGVSGKSIDEKMIIDEISKLSEVINQNKKSTLDILMVVLTGMLAIAVLANAVILVLHKKSSYNIESKSPQSNAVITNISKEDHDKNQSSATNDKTSSVNGANKEQNKLDEVKWQKYTVCSGDTLYGICIEKGIDYWKELELILSINGIKNSDYLKVGQVIILPIVNTEEE